MTIMDKETGSTIQKPYHPTSKTRSIVVTLPRPFDDILGISTATPVSISLSKDKKSMIIKRITGEKQ